MPPVVTPPEVLFFNIDPAERALLEGFADAGFAVVCYEGNPQPALLARHPQAQVLSFCTSAPIGPPLLEGLPNLKLVATRSTAYSHIDLPYLAQRGIKLVNCQNYCSNAVAEHVLGVLFVLARHWEAMVPLSAHGQFRRSPGLIGTELAGKTLGLLGFGHTAQSLAKKATALGLRVLVHSRTPRPELAQALGVEEVTEAKLLAESDILSLQAPLTEATHHWLNAERFAQLKPTVWVVNAARGALIETAAALQALEANPSMRLAVDVLPYESITGSAKGLLKQALGSQSGPQASHQSLLLEQLLIKHPQVLVSPHNAWYTQQAVTACARQTLENITAFYAGQPLRQISLA